MATRPRLLVLAALAALVLLGVVVLYVFVHESASSTADIAVRPDADAPVHATAGDYHAAPALPAASDDSRPEDAGTAVKDYMVGDVRVRDHRSGDHPPLDLPPNVHRPGGRRLPSTLTSDISQQMRKVIWQCAKDVPKQARGAKPQFEAQLTVAITGHTLSIADVAAQVRDVEGPAADALRDCVSRNAAGLTASAADQDDIAGYGLRLAFMIP